MVRTVMIVEVAGAPANHVKEALLKHVEKLHLFKDVTVNSIKASEPKDIMKRDATGNLTEEKTGMFTCFAEVDFEVERFSRVTEIVFDFMPSSVEIIEPGKVTFDAGEASALLNNISGRMHRYDDVARVAQHRMAQMAQKIEELQKKPSESKKKKVAKKVSKKKAAKKSKKK